MAGPKKESFDVKTSLLKESWWQIKGFDYEKMVNDEVKKKIDEKIKKMGIEGGKIEYGFITYDETLKILDLSYEKGEQTYFITAEESFEKPGQTHVKIREEVPASEAEGQFEEQEDRIEDIISQGAASGIIDGLESKLKWLYNRNELSEDEFNLLDAFVKQKKLDVL